ncbi:cadmium resistance transporter [Gloeocapsa sp. PCC 73106]|uniref:cadmium resistance transporter n=1 Tax=Gloeocapsa sp. PCC 73106 TaxID=102232 RepID=UPI0002ABBDCE|nr:cadmium resistance transporter [Gloeocapsa sp. PCC 73106]ELR98857.1 putative permease, cadmium resistance protein [Gloeocapsa sp. PCC 73106]
MSWLVSAVMTGIAAAIATTFDDNIYLTIFFSRINRHFRPQHIVVGEYVGFTLLVAVSLLGFFGGLVISPVWIGLLGFLPIIIGINQLLTREEENNVPKMLTQSKQRVERKSLIKTLKDPQTYRVSAVTIANGGNNIGIYLPLFASSTLPRLSIILIICYLTVGLWCFLSYNLINRRAFTVFISRYARKVFPFVLIWIGLSIVMENQSYQLLANLLP